MTITATIYSTIAPPEPFDPADFPTSLELARKLLERKPKVDGAVYFAYLTEEFIDDYTDTPDSDAIASWSFRCHRNELVFCMATGQNLINLSREDILASARAVLEMLKDKGATNLLLYPADETPGIVYGCDEVFVPPLVEMGIPREMPNEIFSIAMAMGYARVSVHIYDDS